MKNDINDMNSTKTVIAFAKGAGKARNAAIQTENAVTMPCFESTQRIANLMKKYNKTLIEIEEEKPSQQKQMLESFGKDTITDDQIESVLAPVLKGIEEGRFENRRKKTIKEWIFGPIPALIAIAALIISIMLYAKNNEQEDEMHFLPDSEIPLAQGVRLNDQVEKNTISGKVFISGEANEDNGDMRNGFKGAVIQLLRAENGEAYSWTTTGEDGTFKLRGFPDGIYQLRVALPPDEGVAFSVGHMPEDELLESSDTVLLMIRGEVDHAFGINGVKTLDSVDVPIYKTST